METVFQVAGVFLSSSWDVLTGVTVPGLGVSFAVLLVGLFLIGLSLRILSFILGVSFDGGGTAHRAGGKGKAKISKERAGDET